jgi:hypothetical protein
MAKPARIRGLDPDRRLRPCARTILRVRIGEVYAYERAVLDPQNVTELHDMRIAFKRLRYLLEIFGIAFETDLEPFLEEVRTMQDLLGDIHDRDVQVPALAEHLDWLAARESELARALVHEQAAADAPADPDRAYHAFRARFEAGRRADERPGVHALIARRRRERDELYARFLEEWRRLRAA